jgi:peptide deformylase
MIITDEKILRQVSLPIKLSEGIKIGRKLVSVLEKRKDGIGLSAIQVGINKRVFVIFNKKIEIFVNPEIINQEGKLYCKEGCLSLPSYSCIVERAAQVEIISSGRNKSVLRGIDAVVFQHELDHLNGILIKDKKIDSTPNILNSGFYVNLFDRKEV